jgi:hypothetical protein
MASATPGGIVVASPFLDWIQQGEDLYNTALREYHELEHQLDELEARLAAKQAEVNQIAGVIGKPAVEGNRRLSAQLVHQEVIDVPERVTSNTPSSNATIARALTGKFGR